MKILTAAFEITPLIRVRVRSWYIASGSRNGAMFEGGWNAEKYAAFSKWVDAHPDMLKMPRAEFDALLAEATQPHPRHRGPSQP